MHRALVLVAVCLALAPLRAQTPSAVLAPTGTLRAAFLGGNPVQGRVDAVTGIASGVVPDLIRELARSLGVPAVILSRPNAGEVSAAVKTGAADVGFLAFDEERAREVDFSAPFMLMFNSYLVKADSPIRSKADIDQPGVVVAAVRGQSQQLFVSRELKMARVRMLEVMPPQVEVEQLLQNGGVDALAINRQRSLEAQAASSSKLRALPDSFLDVGQSVVVDKGNRAKLTLVERFVADALASGFVRGSVERAKLVGAEAVQPKR